MLYTLYILKSLCIIPSSVQISIYLAVFHLFTWPWLADFFLLSHQKRHRYMKRTAIWNATGTQMDFNWKTITLNMCMKHFLIEEEKKKLLLEYDVWTKQSISERLIYIVCIRKKNTHSTIHKGNVHSFI